MLKRVSNTLNHKVVLCSRNSWKKCKSVRSADTLNVIGVIIGIGKYRDFYHRNLERKRHRTVKCAILAIHACLSTCKKNKRKNYLMAIFESYL